MAKTETLHATAVYDATDFSQADFEFRYVLSTLKDNALRANKTILWDTLDVGITRETSEIFSLAATKPEIVNTLSYIHASVIATEA